MVHLKVSVLINEKRYSTKNKPTTNRNDTELVKRGKARSAIASGQTRLVISYLVKSTSVITIKAFKTSSCTHCKDKWRNGPSPQAKKRRHLCFS